MPNIVAHAAAVILMFVVVPVWIGAGLADYFCHRYSRLAFTSGPGESVLHLVQLGLVGIPVVQPKTALPDQGHQAVLPACPSSVPSPVMAMSCLP